MVSHQNDDTWVKEGRADGSGKYLAITWLWATRRDGIQSLSRCFSDTRVRKYQVRDGSRWGLGILANSSWTLNVETESLVQATGKQ